MKISGTERYFKTMSLHVTICWIWLTLQNVKRFEVSLIFIIRHCTSEESGNIYSMSGTCSQETFPYTFFLWYKVTCQTFDPSTLEVTFYFHVRGWRKDLSPVPVKILHYIFSISNINVVFTCVVNSFWLSFTSFVPLSV